MYSVIILLFLLLPYSRILTAICRLQGDSDRVLFLGFDLLKKPITVNELPVIAALASVWPKPLARKPGVRLVDAQSAVVLKGLEQQLLSYTLEVLTMAMMQGNEAKVHAKVSLVCIYSVYNVVYSVRYLSSVTFVT